MTIACKNLPIGFCIWRMGGLYRNRLKRLFNKSSLMVAGICTVAMAIGAPFFWSGKARADIPKTRLQLPAILLAAPGKVEAQSQELNITADVMGRLERINVKEGDQVHK